MRSPICSLNSLNVRAEFHEVLDPLVYIVKIDFKDGINTRGDLVFSFSLVSSSITVSANFHLHLSAIISYKKCFLRLTTVYVCAHKL